ncbi:hypothetical protein [Oceanirhabdus seepicola]|uniref:Uncharacterized protein n=1 Tax=Oceanirhabdus seepicola TaxID=2828781 RepID=A0A9J6NVS1_9CLOT|nr:hypothetical protein [Oceanirhabdus seepicola]MCM1988583.1 hypothetical protein [Oceanirhabdus seepicola]
MRNMKNMRRIIVLIVAILCCISFVVLAIDKEYNYSIEGKNGITDEQVKEIKSRIDKIYEYFDNKGYELDEIKFIMAHNTRAEHPEDKIIIDFENISDFELMQLILQHEFSEYVNYGLMYGVMYDISKTYNLEFEEVTSYSIQEVEEYWDYISLAYINFTPEIASETEVEISKYVSVELVKYIKGEYGSEYLINLMKDSSDPSKVYKVSEILDAWMKQNNSDYVSNRIMNVEVFNQNPKKNTLEYMTDNINWVLYLDKKDIGSDYYISANDNTKVFYEYMNSIYDEITRLEGIFDFESSELPMLTIDIYSNEYLQLGGIYLNINEGIKLNGIVAFSHEYIHFLDKSLGTYPAYDGLVEMRAVYYSSGFKLNNLMFDEIFIEQRDKRAKECSEIGTVNPFTETEKFLGRAMTYNDYNLLFADIYVHEMLESGHEMPSFFEANRRKGYPVEHWRSLMNYLVKKYGNEAVDTIMLDQKLPDGTNKDMTDVIKEWKVYITNFSEKDYGNYYD